MNPTPAEMLKPGVIQSSFSVKRAWACAERPLAVFEPACAISPNGLLKVDVPPNIPGLTYIGNALGAIVFMSSNTL